MSYQDRLNRRIEAQSKNAEVSYQCLCCKDQAIISRFTVRQYLLDALTDESREEYEEIFRDSIQLSNSSIPILCNRPGCSANTVMVEKEGQRVRVDRYNLDYLIRVNPSFCQWVHEQELVAFRMAEQSAVPAPAKVHAAIAGAVDVIARAVPDVPELQADIITEAEGFRVGDRVVLDISGLDAKTQKDMKRDNDLPRLGEQCTVIRMARKAALNTVRLWITVRFDDGEEIPVLPSYLAHVREVAA